MNSVSKDLLSGIIYASDAHAIWEDLKERFDEVNRVRNMDLSITPGNLAIIAGKGPSSYIFYQIEGSMGKI